MLLIQQVTTDPLQTQTLVLQDGTSVVLTLYYRPAQFGWFINEISWGENFLIQGMRITNSPNMLRQWGNLIPFGLACFTTGNREPTQQEDFATGAAKLYILTEAEVEEYG